MGIEIPLVLDREPIVCYLVLLARISLQFRLKNLFFKCLWLPTAHNTAKYAFLANTPKSSAVLLLGTFFVWLFGVVVITKLQPFVRHCSFST